MAPILNPYLSFDGNAREAMEFYSDVFGAELDLSTYADMGADGPEKDKVMHAHLTTGLGFTLMASDVPPGMEHRPGQNISISLSGSMEEAQTLRSHWQRLSESGTVTVPLEKQIWGDEYGSCLDRFGINWMVDIGTEDSRQ